MSDMIAAMIQTVLVLAIVALAAAYAYKMTGKFESFHQLSERLAFPSGYVALALVLIHHRSVAYTLGIEMGKLFADQPGYATLTWRSYLGVPIFAYSGWLVVAGSAAYFLWRRGQLTTQQAVAYALCAKDPTFIERKPSPDDDKADMDKTKVQARKSCD